MSSRICFLLHDNLQRKLQNKSRKIRFITSNWNIQCTITKGVNQVKLKPDTYLGFTLASVELSPSAVEGRLCVALSWQHTHNISSTNSWFLFAISWCTNQANYMYEHHDSLSNQSTVIQTYLFLTHYEGCS